MANGKRTMVMEFNPAASSDVLSGTAIRPSTALSWETAITPPPEPVLGGIATETSGLSAVKAAATARSISIPSPVPGTINCSAAQDGNKPTVSARTAAKGSERIQRPSGEGCIFMQKVELLLNLFETITSGLIAHFGKPKVSRTTHT